MLVISTDPDNGTCRPGTLVNREFPSVRGVLHVINNIREKDEVKLMTCIFLYFLYLTVTVQILAQQQTGTRSLYSTCSTTDLYKKLVQYLLNNELVQEVGTVPAQQRTGTRSWCKVPAQQRTGTRSWYSTCSTTDWYKKSVQYLLNNELVQEVGTVPVLACTEKENPPPTQRTHYLREICKPPVHLESCHTF